MNWEYRNAPLISSVAFRDGRPLLYDCCLHCPTLLFCIWAQVIRREWLVLVGCILVPDLSLSFVSAFDGMACPVAESKANLNIRNVSDKRFTKMIYFYISIPYLQYQYSKVNIIFQFMGLWYILEYQYPTEMAVADLSCLSFR